LTREKFWVNFFLERIAMPIYEYQALNSGKGCTKCADRFEVIQRASEEPLRRCPACGQRVTKRISLCRAVVSECSDANGSVAKQIKAYESQGMWSHAAELADKHSEKMKDHTMKMRAIDNYSKAGYDLKALERHAKASFGDND
jgi:putative FmdB family regulatory protein